MKDISPKTVLNAAGADVFPEGERAIDLNKLGWISQCRWRRTSFPSIAYWLPASVRFIAALLLSQWFNCDAGCRSPILRPFVWSGNCYCHGCWRLLQKDEAEANRSKHALLWNEWSGASLLFPRTLFVHHGSDWRRGAGPWGGIYLGCPLWLTMARSVLWIKLLGAIQ